ncbi:hypothetical protein Tco_0591410 [Tanacetum coccineum]
MNLPKHHQPKILLHPQLTTYPKSSTSSTSLLPNGYLNPPTSPPPRVSPPPPTQENASMDITLTLSPITPLDVQFDTPSPSPPILEGQATHTVITYNVAYQADDLDAYDSDCDKLNTAKVALMANYLNFGDVYVIENHTGSVQNSNSSTQQDALILSVIEQLKTQVVNCTKINLENKSVNDTLTAELERYKEQVKVLNEGQNVDFKSKDNISDSFAQSVEIDHLKQTLLEHLKEKESLMQMVTLLKNDFKKEESKNIDRDITLEKQIKQLDNIKAQQLEPKLYVSDTIKKTNAIVIPDFEETLVLAKESHLKMLLKQEDPIMLEKKVNTTPVDYVNPLFLVDPLMLRFPKELPKVSMVNTSLKKLKHYLTGFDVVVKERTHPRLSLREKVLVITALKDDLRKLKGKALVDNDVTKHPSDPEMLKIDVEPITPKLLNKQTAHSAYIKHTQEEVIELLTHINKTYLSINNTDGKIVVVTPKNKDKRIRFTEPVTSSGNIITKTASTSNIVSNKLGCLLTVVKLFTSAANHKAFRNYKERYDSTNPSSTQMNKVEAPHLNPSPSWGSNSFRVPFPLLINALGVKLFSWYWPLRLLKHMTGDRSQLTNFVNKFLGTVKFGNDHVAKILGYGDYQIGNVMISRVYYVEGLGPKLILHWAIL